MTTAYWLTILYKYRRKLALIAERHGLALGRYVGKQRETKEAA